MLSVVDGVSLGGRLGTLSVVGGVNLGGRLGVLSVVGGVKLGGWLGVLSVCGVNLNGSPGVGDDSSSAGETEVGEDGSVVVSSSVGVSGLGAGVVKRNLGGTKSGLPFGLGRGLNGRRDGGGRRSGLGRSFLVMSGLGLRMPGRSGLGLNGLRPPGCSGLGLGGIGRSGLKRVGLDSLGSLRSGVGRSGFGLDVRVGSGLGLSVWVRMLNRALNIEGLGASVALSIAGVLCSATRTSSVVILCSILRSSSPSSCLCSGSSASSSTGVTVCKGGFSVSPSLTP